MADSTIPVKVSDQIQAKILHYTEGIFDNIGQNQNFRNTLLQQDLAYYRETDRTTEQARAAAANRAGDASKMQNVVVPVVGPQVDSARSYFVDMYLSSYPIFPVVTSVENVDVGLQMETILGQSAVAFQWGRHFALAFLDGLKHNIQAVEVDWQTKKQRTVINDATKSLTQGSPKEITLAGNAVYRVDPYNLIMDTRVPPAEVHTRGEFVGYCKLITRIELKQLFLDLDSGMTMNATKAFESGTSATVGATSNTNSYYIPQINPSAFIAGGLTSQNWLAWANMDTQKKINYSDMYELTTLYCRIIPKEFGIYQRFGSKNAGDPQIYKFLIINRKVVIFVQRQTNAHSYLPIIVGQMNEDGHGLQTKSYADNTTPYQSIATSLYASAIASQRRKVYDRIIYDPSRINKADIDKADPVARIPVKTEAYGKPISESVYQIPYRDEGVANILGLAREFVDMADVSTGQNRMQRGQFQKGNKTRYEVENVMGNSDARPRTSAILMGISWFAPIKEILKLNILQYQPPGQIFNVDKKTQVNIDPAQLRTISWEFQLADGALPSDSYINFELFNQAIQFAMASPVGAQEWDIMGMFTYQLKLQGARWVDQFKRTPQQQQQFLQQTNTLQNPPQPAPGVPV